MWRFTEQNILPFSTCLVQLSSPRLSLLVQSEASASTPKSLYLTPLHWECKRALAFFALAFESDTLRLRIFGQALSFSTRMATLRDGVNIFATLHFSDILFLNRSTCSRWPRQQHRTTRHGGQHCLQELWLSVEDRTSRISLGVRHR